MFKNSYLFVTKNEFFLLDAEFYANYTRVINHLQNPYANCQVIDIDKSGCSFIVFKTNKKVQKGDELFFDYGDKYNIGWKKRLGN